MNRVVRLLAIALILAALGAPQLRGETMKLNLKFETTNQSMWGAGSAGPPVAMQFTLIDPDVVKWNLQSPGYPDIAPPIAVIDTYFFGDASFGLGGRAKAAGAIGLFANVTLADPGSVDLTYPAEPELTFPDANNFRAGDTITIGSSYARGSDWELKTNSPDAEFSMDARFKLELDLYGKICFWSCTDTTAVGIPSPIVNFDQTVELFSVGTGDQFVTPSWVEKFFPIEGRFGIPEINCSRSATGCQSETSGSLGLRADGHDEFLGATIYVAELIPKAIKYATGIPMPPFRMSVAPMEGVSFHYTLFAADVDAGLYLAQDFAFNPDLKVEFTFPEPLEYWVVRGNGTVLPHVTASVAEMHVGDSINIVTSNKSKDPVPVLPAFRLDNSFSSLTKVTANESLFLEAIDFGIQLPPIEIVPRLCIPAFCIDFGFLGKACFPEACTPAVTWDPPDYEFMGSDALYRQTFTAPEQTLGNLFSGSWQLQGFPKLAGNTLTLDPENPILTVTQMTGAIRNLGEGKRLVPFVIDVHNPGDVPLSALTLQNQLSLAFANARSWKIDRLLACGLDLDPGYDGASAGELLASGNTLAVGETKRVILWAVVSPQPDPEPFVLATGGTGTSKLGTEVGGSASSLANLGPSNPESAADFVLFGDHSVKLQSAGIIGGHVGSNDFIEVKNGTSGNVAGDLRAGRLVKVQGKISADYAISGGIVDVVGKGVLDLFGNVKQFEPVARFREAAVVFAPPTPLLGDVWVEANGARTLTPGHYGDVTVNGGALLDLARGEYHIRSLSIGRGGAVNVAAPSRLVLRELIVGPGASLIGSGRSRETNIEAAQTWALEIGSDALIRGALFAPRANVMFGAGSRIEGSAYGKSITLAPGASATYHNDCDPVVDPNCDDSPDCPAAVNGN